MADQLDYSYRFGSYLMKDKRPAGYFMAHPVFLAAMLATLINNLYLKPANIFPVLAGKISDIGTMIFLPSLICLAVETARYGKHSFSILRGENQEVYAKETYNPSHLLILISISISALLMILLQISGPVSYWFYNFMHFFNAVLFNGRVIAPPTRDLTDMIALPFLLIPYLILTKKREE